MAAAETGGDLLAARINAGSFRFGVSQNAAVIATGTGAGIGGDQAEERFLAGIVEPLQ